MATEDSIIHVFCLVDDQMKEVPKHSQAKLYPSELVTIGLLYADDRRPLSCLLSLARSETMTRKFRRFARSHTAATVAGHASGLERAVSRQSQLFAF